jgi:hypothetical protein
MRYSVCSLAAAFLLAASSLVAADVKSDAAARAKVIAPFVEEETIIVAHVDLTQVDVEAVIDFAARLAGPPPGEVTRAKQEATLTLRKATEAGVKEFYFVIVPGSGGNRGALPTCYGVIPLSSEVDVKAIRSIMPERDNFGRVTQDAFVFPLPGGVVPPGKLPAEFRPVARPELISAFEAAGDSAVQVVLIPPAYAPRVIEEIMPQFPKDLGGGPTTILTRGISWAAVGIDLPPHPAIRLTIKSADAAAAEAFRDKLSELLRLAGKHKQVRAIVPKIDEAATMLVPKVERDRLVLVLNEQNGGIARLVSLLVQPIEVARASAMRMESMNHLRRIAVAMFGYYESGKNHFPLPASLAKDGKPLLSWRVHILPYLGESELYKQFHLDEPWDSPHNHTLIEKMPTVFRLPVSKSVAGRTNYLLPVGGGAAFEADKPTRVQDIVDGTSNTIMVVEVDDNHAVVWTKPEDLSFDPKDPTKGLGRFAGGFNAAICDGSVRLFSWPTEPKQIETLGYLFMRGDRHPVRADGL